MPETTKSILARASDFHHRLADFYDQVSHQVDRERVKMLLEYLSHHEHHLEECLSKYEKTASKRVLNSCFQVLPEKAGVLSIGEAAIPPDTSLTEVMDMALKFDDKVLGLYRELAEQAPSEEVKSLFADLARLEEKEERKLARDALELEDL